MLASALIGEGLRRLKSILSLFSGP